MRHYVVLKSGSGLKLYLGSTHGFGINKDSAYGFVNKEDAEMTAMNRTYTDPRFIGKLEVVAEFEREEQDLRKYGIADIVDAFGDDIKVNVDAVPIRK